MNPIAEDTKAKIQARYLWDKSQQRQTLDDNAIVPYRINLEGRELVAYEIKGGNILKLVSKPPEVDVYWNSTRDRGSAMLLNDLNRGIVANKLNANGERMFFENFYIWTEGIPNDINSDKHLYLEVAGVGNEITFLLGNQSHVELIAAQMKAFEDWLGKLNQALLDNYTQLTRLAMKQGALSSADIVPLEVDIVKNKRNTTGKVLEHKKLESRIIDDAYLVSFKSNKGSGLQALGIGYRESLRIVPSKTLITDITVEIRLVSLYFRRYNWGLFFADGKNTSGGTPNGTAYAMINDINADTMGKPLGVFKCSFFANMVNGYHSGDFIASFTIPNVYLEEGKEKYLFLYLNTRMVPNANPQNFVTTLSTLEHLLGVASQANKETYATLQVSFRITGIGDISTTSLLPEIPEIPEVIEPEQQITINMITIQLIRTAETTNDSIGLRELAFLDSEDNEVEVISNIIGDSGKVIFIIDGKQYAADFILDCDDDGTTTKNQIFEDNGWISGPTKLNRAYTMTLEFSQNEPTSNDITAISVINGNQVLASDGSISEGESWVQTIKMNMFSSSGELVATKTYNFSSNGMKATIDVPQPILPDDPTPPTPEKGKITTLEIIASNISGSYNTCGAKELGFINSDDSIIYADTPLPANQSAVGSFMLVTFTIDNEIYNCKYQVYYGNGKEALSYNNDASFRKAYAMATTGFGYLGSNNGASYGDFKFLLQFDKPLPASIKGISMRNSSTNSSNAGFLSAVVNFKDEQDNVLSTETLTFNKLNTVFQCLYNPTPAP